jgi:hypothetical protein
MLLFGILQRASLFQGAFSIAPASWSAAAPCRFFHVVYRVLLPYRDPINTRRSAFTLLSVLLPFALLQ